MNWSLVQPRTYSDTFAGRWHELSLLQWPRGQNITFAGGDYHRDMQESPELNSRFPAEGCVLSGQYEMSERQKQLRELWREMKNKT